MNNKKNKEGIKSIFLRLDHLVAMSSIEENDVEALVIELNNIEREIARLDLDIKAYTPTQDDIEVAKNRDNIKLTTKQTEKKEFDEQLTNLVEKLTKEKNELLSLEEEERNLKKQIEELTNQKTTFSNYQMKSREFKAFINDLKTSIETTEKRLAEIKAKKKHVKYSVDILNDKYREISEQIESLNIEIDNIEYKLLSTTAYENSNIILDKKRISESFNSQKRKLELRREQIEHNPAYIAQKIKDNIRNKRNYEKVLDLINELCSIINKKPYMNKIIRNGNITALEEEYVKLKKEVDNLEKKIAKADYSLKELPIEKIRQSSIEKLINLNKEQIAYHEQVVKDNEVAIKSLATQIRELKTDYQNRQKDVEVFRNKISSIDDSKVKAQQITELEKMDQTLKIDENIISRMMDDITTLMNRCQEERTVIEKLTAKNQSLSKELSEIMTNQLARNNYKDIIKQNKDERELQELKDKVAWISKRLAYQNYNVSQLKNEIISVLKTIYGTTNVTLHQKRSTEKKEKYQLEEKKEIKLTPLSDILKSEDNKKITPKDVDESIKTFTKTLEFLFPKATLEKTESQKENIEEEVTIDIPSFKLSNKKPRKPLCKTKVVDVQSLEQKPVNNMLKVINIDNIKKPKGKAMINQEENSFVKNIDQKDMINTFIQPVPETEEVVLKK